MNAKGQAVDPLNFDPLAIPYQEIKAKPPGLMNKLRLALLIGGVDISGSGGGVISATHDDNDLERTVTAFDQAAAMLMAEEDLPRT
jgi:glutamate-1-semialdehyde aminotransferase